jgi:methyl-accepting chemotaxis protein
VIHQLSFKRKIGLLVVSAMAGLAIVTSLSVYQTRNEMLEGRRAALRTAVQSAFNIAAGYQAAAAAGTMSDDDAKKAAMEAVRKARYGGPEGKSDYFYIVTTDGFAVMHPYIKAWAEQKKITGTKNAQGVDTVQGLVDAMAASKTGIATTEAMVARAGDTDPKAVLYPKQQYLMAVPGWNWMIGSGLYMDDVNAQVRSAVLKQLSLCLGVLLAIGAVGWFVSRSVIKQLGGEPSEAMAVMSEVSGGNLAVNMPPAPAGSLLASLQTMIESMRNTLIQVRTSTDSISTASNEIAIGNQDLSQRTEQTASNLQQAASSMEQLTGTVKQSADSARQANQLAASAAEVAARGGSVVAQVVTTMDEINASSKKISDIIGVIDGIAFQTNILALNAAVEAARAGEQGRGFAVVASEVRSLAGRSAEAAKEIKGLIGASVDKVEIGSRLVADAGATMTEIVGSVQRVSDIIGEITAASSEQSDGISQVNTAVTQLDQMTQQNAALVEQSAAAAESLKQQAGTLAKAVGTFRLGTEHAAPVKPAAVAPMRTPSTKPAAASAKPKAPAFAAKPAAAKPAMATKLAAAKPAMATKPAAAKPAMVTKAAVAKPAVAPRKEARAPTASKPVAVAAHNDDWETF